MTSDIIELLIDFICKFLLPMALVIISIHLIVYLYSVDSARPNCIQSRVVRTISVDIDAEYEKGLPK